MKIIFTKSENSKTSERHRVLFNFEDVLNMKKYKKSFKNNIFKMSALTWDKTFAVLDGLYSVFCIF